MAAAGLVLVGDRMGLAVVPERPAIELRPTVAVCWGAEWLATARADQLPPTGDWTHWLIMAGRGFGKTRAGAEWVRTVAREQPGARIALVGATMADVRAVMVHGESGVASLCAAEGEPVTWRETQGRLEWANGSRAWALSAVDVDAIRGHQFHAAWCDELAHWGRPEAVWNNLRLALRLGERPRVVVTTTPRPMALLKRWLCEPRVAVTRGATRDNAANLPAGFADEMQAVLGGGRLARQELDGELMDAPEGALWTLDGIAALRAPMLCAPRRIVVGVDPPADGGTCGIVVAALGEDGLAYVLADRSLSGAAPDGWAAAVASARVDFTADAVVAEDNQGGAMVEAVLRAVDADMPLRRVRALRSKAARAEPVAALYARGRVRHADRFAALEDEMARMLPGGASPDRCDALVWAVTELMLGTPNHEPRVRRL